MTIIFKGRCAFTQAAAQIGAVPGAARRYRIFLRHLFSAVITRRAA
jgi:hypothetical protein